MRRPSKNSPNKLSNDSQRLVNLAQGVAQASSRLEERQWEHGLDALLQRTLKSGHQDVIDGALEFLFKSDLGSYDVLMEAVEAGSESCRLEHDGIAYDVLLVAAPILAWTRFAIASGSIPDDVRSTLSAHMHGHLLAADTRLAMAPTLYSIDQLPRTHTETYAMIQRLAQAAIKGSSVRPPANVPETAPFLADTRYLLAAIAAPAGQPLFHWQENGNPAERLHALEQWRTQAGPSVAALLPGCGVELLLPEAYFVGCREADKQIRPASIRAAVHYLTEALAVDATGLRAIIGAFSDDPVGGQVDEYRIGFTLRQNPEVVYGVVWPLYGQEDEEETVGTTLEALMTPETVAAELRTPIEQIIALLRACGVTHIKRHSERFPIEFCEDCGAPLYADAEAELVHAEMPEDAQQGGGHLH